MGIWHVEIFSYRCVKIPVIKWDHYDLHTVKHFIFVSNFREFAIFLSFGYLSPAFLCKEEIQSCLSLFKF